jgi:hypothetical protein
MDRTEIQRQLARAVERVQRGTTLVDRQREVVERLEREGLSTGPAKGMLKKFNIALWKREADRDRLQMELDRVLWREPPDTDSSAVRGVHQVRAEKIGPSPSSSQVIRSESLLGVLRAGLGVLVMGVELVFSRGL